MLSLTYCLFIHVQLLLLLLLLMLRLYFSWWYAEANVHITLLLTYLNKLKNSFGWIGGSLADWFRVTGLACERAVGRKKSDWWPDGEEENVLKHTRNIQLTQLLLNELYGWIILLFICFSYVIIIYNNVNVVLLHVVACCSSSVVGSY